MSLADAVATLPDHLRLWVLWLTVVMIATPLILLAQRDTRRDGIVVLAASVGVIAFMHWLFAQVGFVRLLGLPHVVIWTPLAGYLWLRLKDPALRALPRVAMAVLLVSILVSLVFDYADLIRWLAGDRAPMTG